MQLCTVSEAKFSMSVPVFSSPEPKAPGELIV